MDHLSTLGMKYVPKKELLHILKANLNEEEAKVLISLPTKVMPFQGCTAKKLSANLHLPIMNLEKILGSLSTKGLLYSQIREDNGEKEYAIQQTGFGFPQIFFWKGMDNPHVREMADIVTKYFNQEVTKEIFATKPIPFRFIPVNETVEPDIQAVFPYYVMDNIINNAEIIAVANCSCRVISKLKDKICGHPLEVCIKFNALAKYLIEKGFAREISKEEALKISRYASEAGLVHFTDNAIDNIQQNCNCCGCACWNLGLIRRRRIYRDEIIATYFIRETIKNKCVGCGNCIDICPVKAIKLEDQIALVDKEWCIGCGLCISKCSNSAIRIILRDDIGNKIPEKDFNVLHEKILKNRE
jgi:NAD-dependent dihydropyrimidine dehydrogenase PreA subunit